MFWSTGQLLTRNRWHSRGSARAELFLSADTPDADWVVKLVNLHPDGCAYILPIRSKTAL